MAASNLLLHAHPELISLLFSFIILRAGDFSGFAKLLLIWEWKRPTAQIKFVLERLNWDELYEYHNHYMEVTRDQFLGFVNYSARHNVVQALFFQSSHNLFRISGVEHHLGVLSRQTNTHFPSRFSYLFFKAIYRPFETSYTAQMMFEMISTGHLQRKIEDLMDLLQQVYEYLPENHHLLPPYNLCRNACRRDPLVIIDCSTKEEDLWKCLCLDAQLGNDRHEDELFGKSLKVSHIFKSRCEACTLQLILFKILLGVVRK